MTFEIPNIQADSTVSNVFNIGNIRSIRITARLEADDTTRLVINHNGKQIIVLAGYENIDKVFYVSSGVFEAIVESQSISFPSSVYVQIVENKVHPIDMLVGDFKTLPTEDVITEIYNALYLNNHDKTAYELAVDNGFIGDEVEWLSSLASESSSAYQTALDNGFVGTVTEWLLSLQGKDGVDGLSAYEIAVNLGFIGTEEEWLTSLQGDSVTLTELQLQSVLDAITSDPEFLDSLRTTIVKLVGVTTVLLLEAENVISYEVITNDTELTSDSTSDLLATMALSDTQLDIIRTQIKLKVDCNEQTTIIDTSRTNSFC